MFYSIERKFNIYNYDKQGNHQGTETLRHINYIKNPMNSCIQKLRKQPDIQNIHHPQITRWRFFNIFAIMNQL